MKSYKKKFILYSIFNTIAILILFITIILIFLHLESKGDFDELIGFSIYLYLIILLFACGFNLLTYKHLKKYLKVLYDVDIDLRDFGLYDYGGRKAYNKFHGSDIFVKEFKK